VEPLKMVKIARIKQRAQKVCVITIKKINMKKIVAVAIILLTLASCASNKAGCGRANSWAATCPAYR